VSTHQGSLREAVERHVNRQQQTPDIQIARPTSSTTKETTVTTTEHKHAIGTPVEIIATEAVGVTHGWVGVVDGYEYDGRYIVKFEHGDHVDRAVYGEDEIQYHISDEEDEEIQKGFAVDHIRKGYFDDGDLEILGITEDEANASIRNQHVQRLARTYTPEVLRKALALAEDPAKGARSPLRLVGRGDISSAEDDPWPPVARPGSGVLPKVGR
jgi:hypothetical protein